MDTNQKPLVLKIVQISLFVLVGTVIGGVIYYTSNATKQEVTVKKNRASEIVGPVLAMHPSSHTLHVGEAINVDLMLTITTG